MTDQQPHTPTTKEVRLNYAYLGGTVGEREFERRTETFDRWLATVEAAAEQRGAIKALREAAEHMDTLPDRLGDHWLKPHSVSEFLNYRADRIVNKEGDE